ncbi:MAG TPA: hypothetical protein VL860_07640, partial [Planctomycetota bacterium]|nr:hypothetical protein [Planctomycetota bacterium]
DTQLFFDPFAGGRFALPLFHNFESPLKEINTDTVRRLIEESTLFIEATHGCLGRIQTSSPFKV